MQPRIVEPLICSYGAFRVRQLILEIEGKESRTLEVCRLTLADDPDREIPLKTIHNSRKDLSWIVYAAEEYLDDLTRYVKQLDNSRYDDVDNEKLAEGLRRLSEVSDERWTQLIAQEYLTPHPRQRELMGIIHRRVSEALADMKASHPEGILDVPELIRAEKPALCQAVWDDKQYTLGFWRLELELPQRFTPIVGEQVLEVGPFQVFEELGYYDRTDVRLAELHQRDDGVWVNATYRIIFKGTAPLHDTFAGNGTQSNGFQNDTFSEVVIGSFIDLNVPGVAQLCKPIYAWLAERRADQARNREWYADYLRTMWEQDPEAYDALAKDEEEQDWSDDEYQAVYDAWVALGCPSVPDDDSDPAFDPTKAAVFGTDRSDDEELR